MKKKYNKPITNVIQISSSKILSSSGKYDYVCTEMCKKWHYCLDRGIGKNCRDKEY